MLSAFVHRRPWVAALVGLALGPFVGMLYLGNGATALSYLAAVTGIYVLPPLAAHVGLLPLEAETVILALVIAYRIGGAVHCERVARRLLGEVPAVWFARWYAVIALGIVLPVAMRLLVWQAYNVPAASMEPSLRVGDYIVAVKLSYLRREPRRGDVVVFYSTDEEATPYVKRLVGLPGDTVQMVGGRLHLNGAPVLREPVQPKPDGFREDFGAIYRETLPQGGSYLIREISDTRTFDETDAYEVPPGHYFFLGDNRDNSLDSRTSLGAIPRENFIGPVELIVWNRESQKLRLFDAH